MHVENLRVQNSGQKSRSNHDQLLFDRQSFIRADFQIPIDRRAIPEASSLLESISRNKYGLEIGGGSFYRCS